eukprot:3438988-Pyramimonas_sp.AAC.1
MFGTPLTRFVALWGAPPNALHATTVLTTGYGWVLRQASKPKDWEGFLDARATTRACTSSYSQSEDL